MKFGEVSLLMTVLSIREFNQARTTSGFFIGGNMGAGRVDVELESGSELRGLYV